MRSPFKFHPFLGTAGLVLAGSLTVASAAAQATPPNSMPPAAADQAAPASSTPDPSPTYATGKPLENTSREGFWGHMNPFARKKWVHRQVDPIKDRANELDQVEAKNANDIRAVDARATAGINRAMTTAQVADSHAADAAHRADQAHTLATSAGNRATSLDGTVSNLDQYQQVSATSLRFVAGHTVLTTHQKADLDRVATSLASEKGYIVEVQGYSRAGVPASQAMADSVVRYLVTAQHVPVYRIYRTGLGKATPALGPTASTGDDKPLTNGVTVTVLHNSLATMSEATQPTNPAE